MKQLYLTNIYVFIIWCQEQCGVGPGNPAMKKEHRAYLLGAQCHRHTEDRPFLRRWGGVQGETPELHLCSELFWA